MDNIIFYGVMLIISIVAFLLGKYVFPKVPKEALDVLGEWAGKLVIWAREFMDGETGEAKMETVVAHLKEIADEQNISITEVQLQALVQTAYECFIKGEANA